MDANYILSCAAELGELTPVEAQVLSHPAGALTLVEKALRDEVPVQGPWLVNLAREHLNRISPEARHFFALKAMPTMALLLEAFMGRTENLVQEKIQSDLDRAATPLLTLYPELADMAETQIVQAEKDVSEGAVRLILERTTGPALDRWCEDFRMMNAALAWCTQGNVEELYPAVAGSLIEMCPEIKASIKQLVLAQKEHDKRKARERQTKVSRAKSAIKKASKLFMGLGKDDSLKLFVSGHEVTLSHPDSSLKFILKPLNESGWLLERTQAGRSHTPYDLAVYSKDDVFLANLCVYFNNTPVLDQLLALTLYIESGNELALLEKANWFSTGAWSEKCTQIMLEQHPSLEAKIPKKSNDCSSPIVGIHVNPQFVQKQEEWDPYRGRVQQWLHTWAEPLLQDYTQIESLVKGHRELIGLLPQALLTAQ